MSALNSLIWLGIACVFCAGYAAGWWMRGRRK